MIKLKSLFRRGQGPSQGVSSKHSNNSNSICNKSQSTQSLNTTGDENQQFKCAKKLAISNVAHTNKRSERDADADDQNGQSTSNKPTLEVKLKNCTPAESHAHTLPYNKKQKSATPKKGHKQAKQSIASTTAFDIKVPKCTILSSTGDTPTTSMATVTQVVPNSANAFSVASVNISNSHKNLADQLTLTCTETTSNASNDTFISSKMNNDSYALNPAFMVTTTGEGYQFLKNEQQQFEASSKKMQELELEVTRLNREKLLAETHITELLPYQSEVNKLKTELIKLHNVIEKQQLDITNLKYENQSLRNRLRDVVNSPLSDAEKHQIIQDSQRLHSSAPASIALPNNAADNDVADVITSGLTPDWDKHSSSSEVSVACLQDKIIQMEETHYSTNEELQATLQELADLQTQLSDAQAENERLVEEKDVLFQSLCRQTEKLNESRSQINNLQELLLNDNKQTASAAEMIESNSERENKLLDLIKTTQNERETMLIKQEELNSELQELRQNNELILNDKTRLRERISLLESTIDVEHTQRKQMETQIIMAKEEISQRLIEIDRLTTLLENAKSKIEELEQDLARGDKTDLSNLLDTARKEKDTLEERVAVLQEQYARSQAEIRRLKEQLTDSAEELKVAKNNSKCALSHLEYRLEQLQLERDKLSTDNQQLCESTDELQIQCKCHLEDKMKFQTLLNENQKRLSEVERKLDESQKQLEGVRELRQKENEEWQQFQADLLMTVRVANDFKTEALSAREKLVLENKIQKEKIRMLEQQIDKLAKQQQQQNETQQSVLTTVQQEMASRRNKLATFSRQDSRLSVKTLIESIENNKQTKLEESTESHNSSSSSLNIVMPEISSNVLQTTVHTNDWPESVDRFIPLISNFNSNNNNNTKTNNPSIMATTVLVSSLQATAKTPLRDQQHQQSQQMQQPLVNNIQISSLGNLSKSLTSGERKDPLNMLAKNGGSKRNALLKWCQNKTVGYRNIDITNFSSSWNDGLAFCAILHSYLPDRIPYDTLSPANKRRNFALAFAAAESVGIPTTLNIIDMCQIERPDWTHIMSYVTAIYKHFET